MGEQHATSAARLERLMSSQVQEQAGMLLDVNGRVVSWLFGAERIFGYGADVGKRSEFTVRLPLAEPAPAEVPSSEQ